MKKLFAIVAMLGLFTTAQVNAENTAANGIENKDAGEQTTPGTQEPAVVALDVEKLKVDFANLDSLLNDSLKFEAFLNDSLKLTDAELNKGKKKAKDKIKADAILALRTAAKDSLVGLRDSWKAQLDSIEAANAPQVIEGGNEVVSEGGIMAVHKGLKTKFIEGGPEFMALVSIALVIGLAFCIERIIYLSLAKVNARKLMGAIADALSKGDVEGAKAVCRNTPGPVASICYQGLLRIDEGLETVERSIVSYGSLQSSMLEKGCSWITLFIAMAPSLGFLGTVVGMVMAFDEIQAKGDISPTIVAGGMKVALITTIYGIIVALVLQVLYNFILTKIESIVADMEDSSITLLDLITKYNLKK